MVRWRMVRLWEEYLRDTSVEKLNPSMVNTIKPPTTPIANPSLWNNSISNTKRSHQDAIWLINSTQPSKFLQLYSLRKWDYSILRNTITGLHLYSNGIR